MKHFFFCELKYSDQENVIQLFRIWGLLRVLKTSGRFSFNNNYENKKNLNNISIEEAYRILNLDPKSNPTKKEVVRSYKKIMTKIHPDISPQTARLAQICTEAKDEILKKIS